MTEITTGICKVAKYATCTFYKAHCSCGTDEHTQTLILDLDEHDVIMLSIHSKIYSHYDSSWCDTWQEKLEQWWNSQKLKWKQVFTLIFTGQIEAENEFMFYGKEQIQSYIDALQEGLNQIEEDKCK